MVNFDVDSLLWILMVNPMGAMPTNNKPPIKINEVCLGNHHDCVASWIMVVHRVYGQAQETANSLNYESAKETKGV